MVESAFINNAAEMAVIGAAMQDPDAARKIALLDNDLFADFASAAVHRAIRGLVNDAKPVDLVNILPELDKDKNKPQRADASYIVECVRSTPAVSMWEEYAKVLYGCQARRKLDKFALELRKQASSMDTEADAVRQWAIRELKEIQIGADNRLETLSDALIKTYQQIEVDHTPEADGTDGRIYSGIQTLDERLGGLKGGLYVAIGARPGVGKSILALTYCLNAAMSGKRVLLVSLEMDTIQITQRVMAAHSDVTLKQITGDTLDEKAWSDLGQTMVGLGNVPLWYSTHADTIDKVRASAYQLYENGGLDMIAIDYLQLMDATYSKRQNRQEQIAEISRGLRKLAQELSIPILVLTQLNRQSVRDKIDGARREPTMADARESGSIEQDANIFALLHEIETEDEMKTDSGKRIFRRAKEKGIKIVRIIVDKNRQGRQSRTDVAFDGAHMRYIDLKGKTEDGTDGHEGYSEGN